MSERADPCPVVGGTEPPKAARIGFCIWDFPQAICGWPMVRLDAREIVAVLGGREGMLPTEVILRSGVRIALVSPYRDVLDAWSESRSGTPVAFSGRWFSCRYCGKSGDWQHTCQESREFYEAAEKHQRAKDAGECSCVQPCGNCGLEKRGEYSHSDGCARCGMKA